jgi:hypothetical protein
MTTQDQILAIACAVRSDAWVDFAANGAYSLGFVDNREGSAPEYNASATVAAQALKAAGFRVKVREGNADWPLAVVTVRG